MPRRIDLTGRRFGQWLVMQKNGKDKRGKNAVWLCQCNCGKIANVPTGRLTGGHSKGCGCTRNRRGKLTHGLSHHRLYIIWANMKQRCNNPNAHEYENYGGRGITVCKEWETDFVSFYNWATNNGYDDNLTIDRINNEKGYSPDNCRWATKEQQYANMRQKGRLHRCYISADGGNTWSMQYLTAEEEKEHHKHGYIVTRRI